MTLSLALRLVVCDNISLENRYHNVLHDRSLCLKNDLTVEQRIQRDVYLEADQKCIVAKYVKGHRII